jgi:Family of unknown function (DUF6504)
VARRHRDPVTVRGAEAPAVTTGAGALAGSAGDPAGDPWAAGPRDFVWRGRRYTVCAVLASWQERRAWWREVGDHPDVPGMPSPQRRVWRVEARPPSGSTGVFDLGRDDDHWLLLRAHD